MVDSKARWYVLKSSAGQEKKAIKLLKEQLALRNMDHLVEEIFVPSETVVYKKSGKQTKKNVSYFPGYILIKAHLTDQMWYVLKDIKKISGFIGSDQTKPDVVLDSELELIKKNIDQGTKQSEIDSSYQIGESVLIIEGPFADFKGVIDSVDKDKNRLVVTVSIFGRTTPIELEMEKVKPVNQ